MGKVTRLCKMRILRISIVFIALTLTITGHLRGVEGATRSGIRIAEGGNATVNGLSEEEAKKVQEIWRVIGDQEIVKWDGKEWLVKTETQKKEVIKMACEAWREAGYQKIESIEYFIEDIDKYYHHFKQKNPEVETKEKVGLVLSLSAFFSGIETSQK